MHTNVELKKLPPRDSGAGVADVGVHEGHDSQDTPQLRVRVPGHHLHRTYFKGRIKFSA